MLLPHAVDDEVIDAVDDAAIAAVYDDVLMF
jgi:hypothetical protein